MNSAETADIVMSESSESHARVRPPPRGTFRGALPFWCVWPNGTRPQFIVRCNRDVVPQIPSQHARDPEECVDGRLGLFEPGQLPQFHIDGEYHRAFAPVCAPTACIPLESGRPWWYMQHTDSSGDLSSFRLTAKDLCQAGAHLVRPHVHLRRRAFMAVLELKQQMAKLEKTLMITVDGRLTQALRDLETITDALRNQALHPWEHLQTFALWQRNVSEVKAWFEYLSLVGAMPWSPPFADDAWALDSLKREADRSAERLRLTHLIRHSRGVFVAAEAVAYQYAAHDVPVWYLQPFSSELAASLQAEQRAGLLRRAFYRKYGSEKCAYMHPVEQRFFAAKRGRSTSLALSRSRQAYPQAEWDEVDAAAEVVGSSSRTAPAQHDPAPQPSSSSNSRLQMPASLPAEPLTTQPARIPSVSSDLRLHMPASLPDKPKSSHPAATSSTSSDARLAGGASLPPKPSHSWPPAATGPAELPSTGTPMPNPPGDKSRGKKRNVQDTEDPSGRPKKSRRTVRKLIRAEHAPTKASEVQVNTSAPSLFATTDRPVWFPVEFAPGEETMSLVDDSRPRQVRVSALQRFAVPKAVVSKGRRYKAPLVSYFVNVWHETRGEGYGLKRGKHGKILEGQSEIKSPESVLSKLFLVWAKFRGYYLRKLAMSSAEDIPGLTPTDWRKAMKLVTPPKDTPRVIAIIGLDAAFPTAEPDIVAVSSADDEEPVDDLPDDDVLDEATSAPIRVSVPASATIPAPASMAAPVPVPVPAPEPVPVPAPLPQTIGEVFDLLPHPSFLDHALPPFAYTEDEAGGWPTVPWRKFMLWELREIEFRHELLALDLTLRQAHPDLAALQDIAPEQRFYDCKACWGGSDLTPGCDDWAENALVHADLRVRLRGLRRFAAFMRVWPRADEFLAPWETFLSGDESLDRVDISSDLFLTLERSAWLCFGQTFYDYRQRFPPVPYVRPPLPT